MTNLIAAAFIATNSLISGMTTNQIAWTKHSPVGSDGGNQVIPVINLEIGFRGDGVVVWREKSK